MIAIETLLRNLHSRGVVLEPAGDMLAVDPIDKVEPAELEAVREHKQEILRLFQNKWLQLVECPDEVCGEILLVIDGLAYCRRHCKFVRFVELAQ